MLFRRNGGAAKINNFLISLFMPGENTVENAKFVPRLRWQ